MGNILEKIRNQIQQPSQELANRLIHDDISEEEFCRYIAGRNSLWIGIAKEKKRLYQLVLSSSWAKSSTLYLGSKEDAMIEKVFEPPYKEHFHQFKDLVERSLFLWGVPSQSR